MHRPSQLKCKILGLIAGVAISVQGFTTVAEATSLDDSIQQMSGVVEEYHAYNELVTGGNTWAGSMYDGYKLFEHRCAIVGRLLGFTDAVRSLEEFDYLPMDSSSDVHDLLVFTLGLDNWILSAIWARDATQDQRINYWNLDCIGRYGIPPNLAMQADRPDADFELRGSTMLLVYGDIETGFANRFVAFLDANPSVLSVVLGSAGGSLSDALIAGRAIRTRGIDTSLHGNCRSACALVFLGGVRRINWRLPFFLGFHQVYSTTTGPIPFNDPIYKMVSYYVAEMGVSPDVVLAWMQSASPEEMYTPSGAELCDSLVATWIQRECGVGIDR